MVALALALPLIADGGVPAAPLPSIFGPASQAELDEIEGFRLHRVELQEAKEATRARWASRTADDPELAELRALAAVNDAILAAGGALAVPDDRRSLAAMMPRHDENGIMYVQVGADGPLRVVVPAGCVSEAVHAVHAGPQLDGGGAAHGHRRRVVAIARRWLWWRTMYRDIAQWCIECVACQRHRLLTSRPPANLGDSEASRAPKRLADWQLDSYELQGVRFFTAVELYSGLLIVSELPDASSLSFTQAFEQHVVVPFGAPEQLYVDGGGENEKHFSTYCLAQGIDVVVGQAYNPQSQARVERAHRTLSASVAKAVAEGSKAPIATIVSRVAHEMNIAPCDSDENLSPHRLLHALEPVVPIMRFLQPKADVAPARAASLRAQVDELERAHAALEATRTADRVARRAKHEAAVAGSHSAAVSLAAGDVVWANPPPVKGGKLDQHLAWSGPWEVTSFDEVTGKVELAFMSDSHVRYRAAVHVRNTRPFSAQRPLDERHLLDETVFPAGWEHSTLPLGGMARMPERVREGVDQAIAEAARQAQQSEAERRADDEREQEARARAAKEVAGREAEARRERDRVAEAERKAAAAEVQRAANETILDQLRPDEVLRVDMGNRRVRVKRKDGKEVWFSFDEVEEDSILKALVENFKAIGRASRLNRGVRS